MTSKDINSVFIAKCIGISLVVIGHYAPESQPMYWVKIREIIYCFHMPLFFLIAGYLYGFSPPKLDQYFIFVKKKAKRLLIPFASIAMLFFLIKFPAGLLFNLQHPVTLDSLVSVLINPLGSYLTLLWFVYALFIIFLVFPMITILLKDNLFLLMIVTILFYFIEWTRYFCLAEVFHNLPFFAIGYMAGRKDVNMDNVTKKNALSILVVSILVFVLFCLLKYSIIETRALSLAVSLTLGISGSIACISLSILALSLDTKYQSYLKNIGLYSMSIYLLHTLFSGVVRVGFYHILRIPNAMFIYGAIIAVLVGVVIPLQIEKHLLRKYSFTRKAFLGLG